MKNKMDKVILETMINNPENWKGPFYFNRKDYRIIVPKRNKLTGYTLNYASPYTYLSLAAIAIIVVVSKYFLQ